MSKVLLITEASRGIGAATARLAALNGWSVGVNYHQNKSAAKAVVAEIIASGSSAISLGGDVANEDDVKNIFDECEANLGPLTGLINNVGILQNPAKFEGITLLR